MNQNYNDSKLMTPDERQIPEPASSERPVVGSQPPTPVIDVRELLAGAREAVIVHGGERYRLRLTANHKLILTK
jgi:hemin uptake protein HemP